MLSTGTKSDVCTARLSSALAVREETGSLQKRHTGWPFLQRWEIAYASRDIPCRQADFEVSAQVGVLAVHCCAWLRLTMLQDKFFTQLRNSADGFNVIADFFGRGILNSPAAASH